MRERISTRYYEEVGIISQGIRSGSGAHTAVCSEVGPVSYEQLTPGQVLLQRDHAPGTARWVNIIATKRCQADITRHRVKHGKVRRGGRQPSPLSLGKSIPEVAEGCGLIEPASP